MWVFFLKNMPGMGQSYAALLSITELRRALTWTHRIVFNADLTDCFLLNVDHICITVPRIWKPVCQVWVLWLSMPPASSHLSLSFLCGDLFPQTEITSTFLKFSFLLMLHILISYLDLSVLPPKLLDNLFLPLSFVLSGHYHSSQRLHKLVSVLSATNWSFSSFRLHFWTCHCPVKNSSKITYFPWQWFSYLILVGRIFLQMIFYGISQLPGINWLWSSLHGLGMLESSDLTEVCPFMPSRETWGTSLYLKGRIDCSMKTTDYWKDYKLPWVTYKPLIIHPTELISCSLHLHTSCCNHIEPHCCLTDRLSSVLPLTLNFGPSVLNFIQWQEPQATHPLMLSEHHLFLQ